MAISTNPPRFGAGGLSFEQTRKGPTRRGDEPIRHPIHLNVTTTRRDLAFKDRQAVKFRAELARGLRGIAKEKSERKAANVARVRKALTLTTARAPGMVTTPRGDCSITMDEWALSLDIHRELAKRLRAEVDALAVEVHLAVGGAGWVPRWIEALTAAADAGDADLVRKLIAEARAQVAFQLDREEAVRAAVAELSEADLNL